jgi:tetratricopeptide (TPR) repeat protein
MAQSVDPRQSASYVSDIALVRKTQGRLHEAQQLSEQSVVLHRQMDDPGALAEVINIAGHVLLAQGDLEGARKNYQEARDLRQKIAVRPDVADSMTSFALLALAEGRPAEAEPLLKDAIEEFGKDRSIGNQVMAIVLLSRALLAQGQLDEAQKTLTLATDLARKNADPAPRLLVAVQRARVEGAGAGSDAAGKKQISQAHLQLQSLIVTTKQLGYYELECEARLALGELELKTNPPSGRLRLSALAKEAHEHGLELVVRKATQISSRSANLIATMK